MTDELKTLKEIPDCMNWDECAGIEVKRILRAEAIRRAKTKIEWLRNNRAVKNLFFNKGTPMVVIDTTSDNALMALAWTTFGEIKEIIEFNNLTEEDIAKNV